MEEALADDDCNLVNLLKRARSVNLKFNKNKLRLKLDQVTYMVQLFTSEGLKPDPIKIEAIASMPRPDDKRAVQRLLVTEKKVMSAHRRKLSSNQKHDQLCTPVEAL